MLDSVNENYVSRLQELVSAVSSPIEKWDSFQDPSLGIPLKAKKLAYSIRKLSEMLSSLDILRFREQPFVKQSRDLTDSRAGTFDEEKCAERAMTILCEGFAQVQNRLDLGLEPFVYGSPTIVVIERDSTTREGITFPNTRISLNERLGRIATVLNNIPS
jgi:hypothetical protein